jgi:SUMO ligase MMS21 Smc5/6 complex component
MNLFKTRQPEEPRAIEVSGRQLRCPICSNTLFWTRQAQLNTAVATFFNMDWANKSASCFICSDCTHISWFLGGQ